MTARNHQPDGGFSARSSGVFAPGGHDAFLLEEPELFAIVRGFLEGAGKVRGLA